MIPAAHVRSFEEARPALRGLAYRLLGSLADAEDAVQDTYVRWAAADRASIRNPGAWLTTVCTRLCLDVLKSSDRTRVDYVGPWLPELVHTRTDGDETELAASLSTAFLLLLERLTPRERAAYLLREIFDHDYAEVAHILDANEAACRKLVSRAQSALRAGRSRPVAPPALQEELLDTFLAAVHGGGTGRLGALLADDVALTADGGGKASAVNRVLRGPAEVLAFVGRVLGRYWAGWRLERRELNGSLGLALYDDDQVQVTVGFGYDANGALADIYVMRNPEKLAGLAETADLA